MTESVHAPAPLDPAIQSHERCSRPNGELKPRNRHHREGMDIRTCEDLRHLNVECCDTCHNFYPHYEMSVIDLPDGGKAWVCDTVKWAIYPEKYRELNEWSRNSPGGKLLRKIFGEDVDE